MFMKPLFLVAALIVLLATNSYAQNDFRPGYVITNDSDTLRGLIDYKGNKSNSQECRFRTSTDSPTTTYSPSDIRGYRYDGSKYFISMALPENPDTRYFFEFLINGIVDVYFLRDQDGDHYYVEGDGRLTELKGGEREIVKNGQRYIKQNKVYVGQLKVIFKESAVSQKKAESVKLSHASLIDVAKKYHEEVCTSEGCVIYERRLPKTLSWGLYAGMNQYQFIVPSNNYEDPIGYLNSMDFDQAYYPSVGVFFKWNLPTINEKLYFSYDAVFSKRKLDGASVENDGVGSFIRTTTNSFKFEQVSINNLFSFGYQFPKGSIKPLFEAGGFLEYNLKNDFEHRILVTRSWSDFVQDEKYSHNYFNSYDLGFLLGAGVAFQRKNGKPIIINARYLRGGGVYMEGGYIMATRNITLSVRVAL
jgi:hypothetical protein